MRTEEGWGRGQLDAQYGLSPLDKPSFLPHCTVLCKQPRMQKKITPIVENTANTLERKHEEYVVIPVRDPEELQNRYAKAHKSTGKELAVFMAILIVIVMGFFLAAKLL